MPPLLGSQAGQQVMREIWKKTSLCSSAWGVCVCVCACVSACVPVCVSVSLSICVRVVSLRLLALVLVFPFHLLALLFPALTFSSVFGKGSRIVRAGGNPGTSSPMRKPARHREPAPPGLTDRWAGAGTQARLSCL